jgi:hypothetical protein
MSVRKTDQHGNAGQNTATLIKKAGHNDPRVDAYEQRTGYRDGYRFCEIIRVVHQDTVHYLVFVPSEKNGTWHALWREITPDIVLSEVLHDPEALKICISENTPWPEVRELFYSAYKPVIMQTVEGCK